MNSTSRTVGIIGIVTAIPFCIVAIPINIIAIVLGLRSKKKGLSGNATAGIKLGGIGLALAVITAVILGIVVYLHG